MRSVDVSLEIFAQEKYEDLPEAARLEQEVDDIQERIVNAHIQRLMETSCDPLGGVIYTDMTTDLERCSDHGMNIAEALAPQEEESGE